MRRALPAVAILLLTAACEKPEQKSVRLAGEAPASSSE